MAALIIYDTEFTAWPGSKQRQWSGEGEAREIIQLAAIKVTIDNQQLKTVASLNVLVKPLQNPQLSDYIQQLTGIQQSVLDDHGVDFVSCAELFYEFTENASLPCFSWGPDQQVLMENFRINHLTWDHQKPHFVDLKSQLLTLNLDFKDCISGELAAFVGKPLSGHKHNALFDVKNILVLLQTLLNDKRLDIADILEMRGE